MMDAIVIVHTIRLQDDLWQYRGLPKWDQFVVFTESGVTVLIVLSVASVDPIALTKDEATNGNHNVACPFSNLGRFLARGSIFRSFQS